MVAQVSTTSVALATLVLFLAVAITQAVDTTDKADGGGKGQISPTSKDLVVEACKNMSKGDLMGGKTTHFKEMSCIFVLRSDNRSAVAKDYGDLVLVALDTLSLRSNQVASSIGEVLRGNKTQNSTEHALRYCDTDYGFMMKTLPSCRDIFLSSMKAHDKNGEWDDPLAPLDCMDRFGAAARDCYSWLDKKDYKEPLKFEIEYVIKHANLAWGLMEIALNYVDHYSWW